MGSTALISTAPAKKCCTAVWNVALIQPLHRFLGQFVKPTAALCNILFDLIAHAALPELAEMVGNAGDSLLMRISCEKEGDLIRTVNHTFRGHVRGYFAELDSPSICVVLRRVSR
jgi:hypothetical protein